MAKRDYHVVPHPEGWAVRREGNDKVSSVQPTQQDAIDVGRQMAQNQNSELVIHRADGRIRDSDSYGRDPNPPRDTKH